MKAEEFFADGWTQLAPRLRASLARAGAPVADRDDLIQETAIRLLGMWDAVDWSRPIEPLARQIALNLWRDQWRKTGRRELVGEVAEQVAGDDTERAAVARVQVGEVSRALSSLPVATAAVLRLAVAESESGIAPLRTSGAVRMARTRARRALLACVKVASAVVVATRAAGHAATRAVPPAAALGALVTVACLLTLGGTRADSVGSAGEVMQTPGRPQAALPATDLVAERQSATRSMSAAHVRHNPGTTPTPYYVISAGPGSVAAFLDVKVFGTGAQVREPDKGSQAPACVHGDPMPSVVLPSCK